jgi:triosephosphate isomerase
MQGDRKRFVGGNWKSNNTLAKSLELVDSVVNKLEFDNVDVVVSPVSLHIVPVQ